MLLTLFVSPRLDVCIGGFLFFSLNSGESERNVGASVAFILSMKRKSHTCSSPHGKSASSTTEKRKAILPILSACGVHENYIVAK
jgi:hypothetical protein